MDRVELSAQVRRTPLRAVKSTAVRAIGYAPQSRMVCIRFVEGDVVYGYPNLSDDEIAQLLHVLEDHESLGHFVSTVVKPNHDHEHVRSDRAFT